MVNVIKRGGKKQGFSPAKIRHSVEYAAKDAGLKAGNIKKLVAEVAEPVIAWAKTKRMVRVSAIRKAVLGRLDRKAKSVAHAWRRFKKKR